MISNTVSNVLILSFLLFSFVASVLTQSLDDEISTLPTCATTCLSKAAAAVKCGTGDFACQCANQDSIVGILGRVSSQTTCLIGDCGISNTTTTRVTFKKICSILSAASSSTTASAVSVATALSTSSEQVLAPSTSSVEIVSSSIVEIPATSSSVPPTTSALPQTSIATQISFVTSVTQPTVLTSSSSSSSTSSTSSSTSTTSSTPLPIPTSTISSTLVQPTVESTPIAVSVSTTQASTTSVSSSASSSTTSYTSVIMGAAKMSPVAESNSWNPIQAGEATPIIPVKQTKPKLGPGAVIGIIVGAVVAVVAILGVAFCCWRTRKMRSLSNRKIIVVEEKTGIEPKSEGYQAQEPKNERVKSLPPRPLSPVSPTTPGLANPSYADRESGLTLNFEYSPPPQDSLTRTSRLQPTIYNPSQSSSVSPEPRSFISQPDETHHEHHHEHHHRSRISSFFPSNQAHKSGASSFFASIPILLDSREGRCEDCLNNQEKYRFRRASGKISPPVCACASKHPPKEPHSPSAVDGSRAVSGLSITRSEVEEELLVGRVPTLMSERGVSGSSVWADELELERELSKISEQSEAKPLRSNPFVTLPRPLFSKKQNSKDSFDFGFLSRRRS